MKIISNFKDYYDSMQQYGQDEKIVFQRIAQPHINFDSNIIRFTDEEKVSEDVLSKVKNILMQDKELYVLHNAWQKYEQIFNRMYLPFPKLNNMIIVVNGESSFSTFVSQYHNEKKSDVFLEKNMTKEEIFNTLAQELKKKNYPFSCTFWEARHKKWQNYEQFHEDVANFKYAKYEQGSRQMSKNDWLSLHKEKENPVLMFHIPTNSLRKDVTLHLNMPLRYFGIDNLLGSADKLHQEISYCVANIIQDKNQPPIEINDQDRLSAHGFDSKISFRHRK